MANSGLPVSCKRAISQAVSLQRSFSVHMAAAHGREPAKHALLRLAVLPLKTLQLMHSHVNRKDSGKKLRRYSAQAMTSDIKGGNVYFKEPNFSPLTALGRPMEKESLSGFLTRVAECNTGLERRNEFWPFIISGITLGHVHESFMLELSKFEDVFVLSPSQKLLVSKLDDRGDKKSEKNADRKLAFSLELHPNFVTLQERTKAVGEVLKKLKKKGLIKGWRDELYPVSTSFHSPPSLLVERASAAMFGVKVYGVHVNGYVRMASGELHLWVARRSLTKPTFPGKLDHLVAGGQPHGLSCVENVLKECVEEAAIPLHLSRRAVAVGAVSYESVAEATLKRDVLFCYDLELPPDFVPRNNDGEVDSFELLPLDEVCEIINKTNDYKPNCAVVVIDFLVRHGYVTPEQHGYLELIRSLRQGDCS